MSRQDAEIVAEFVIESREHLADVENQLLAIEAGGANIDLALVNDVFRAVHSIKGAAGFLGFATLGRLAHELENVLNLIRNRELVPDSSVTNVMLKAADTLRAMIEDIENSNGVDIGVHLEALECLVQKLLAEETDERTAAPAPPSTEPARAPEPTSVMPQPSRHEDTESPSTPAIAKGAEASPQRANVPEPTRPAAAAPAAPSSSGHASPGGEANIRVAVSVLDGLMNLAGELVLSRNQLLQTLNNGNRSNLDSVASRLDQVTSELQETIMQARMQMVGTVFNRFPRVVRDLSGKLHKQCELRIEGADVELDKSIIEAIGDPLTHLVRNSIDHGIEPPERRLAAGKPAHGTIVLRAFHQAGKVNINISDDGRGIDAAKLRDKAAARGILSAEQARSMSEQEALRLIFRPAFSMAEQVTDVSGRGVGMDVVKTNIEKLGGTVGVETRVGVGTTVNIKLPLTLAIIPSLIVHTCGWRFAIPQASISELVRIRADEIAVKVQHLNRAEVFRLRGQLIPLVNLTQVLGLAAADARLGSDASGNGQGATRSAAALSIIVVEAGQLRYGIVVDGLHDSEEIVVKPLGRHLQGNPCLAGATILGDAVVAMILDATGIANHCRLALPEDAERIAGGASEGKCRGDIQTVLLFRNHPSERFGVPTDLINRVERIRTDQIDSVGGQLVLQYRHKSLPLLRLEDHIAAKAAAESAKVYVAVFRVLDREIGLIVPELVDIRRVAMDVDNTTFRQPGVFGSVVVDGETIRLVDVYELAETARPSWFRCQPAPTTHHSVKPRVLLAEDSQFFRTLMTELLKGAGYEVTACEDGELALRTLQDAPHQFDILVTDVEMPNLNGFELARRVKDDPGLAHLPIVAVTSLAGDDDVRRGKDAGIDDYQVKLDREALFASIAKYVQVDRRAERCEAAVSR